MNRAERDRLLEQYLSGELSSGDESEFFIQVALDKELRQELKAQRVIESALQKDLQSEATEHTALRERVAAMVAASRVDRPSVRNAEMAPPVPRGATRGSGRKRRWALAPIQWVFATGLALSFTVGAVIGLPSGRIQDEISRPVQEQFHQPAPGSTAWSGQRPIAAMIVPGNLAAALLERPWESPRAGGMTARPGATSNRRGTSAYRNGASSLRTFEEKSVVTHRAATHANEEAPSSSTAPAHSAPMEVGVKIHIQTPAKP